MTSFAPLGHVAVTVSDLPASTAWYSRLFDAEPALDEDEQGGQYHHTVWALPSGQLFGIHLHNQPVEGGFQAGRPGLDHVAFACADRAELEAHTKRLDSLGIEHGELIDAHYGSGVAFRDPDGIALEFFAPPS